jgi:hypothetical protein
MEEINSIMENLLRIPVYELTTGMFMQIQELKELATKPENADLFMEKYKLYNFDKGLKKHDNTISISSLYKKIQTLEKINSELQAKMSSITFDNIYLLGDLIKPTYGNILIYTVQQNNFWIIPYSMLEYPIVSTFTTSNQIAGWHFSNKGWQALLLNDNKLHISVKIEENKKIQNNNVFSVLETPLWKVLIQKNNNVIPIYSSLTESHTFLGDFSNIHRLNVYVKESKTFYIEKLQHTFLNLLQWNFTYNDFIMLSELVNGNWTILNTIKKDELLQPLFSASVIIYPHEEDLVNWSLLMNLLKTYYEKGLIHLPKLSLFTKTTKIQLLTYYSNLLADNSEFKKVISDNTIFEEQYQIFNNFIESNTTINDIRNLLTTFQKREQPRKIDCWIEMLRYLFTDSWTNLKYYINLQIGKLIETENILISVHECITNIKMKGHADNSALIPLPKSANSKNYDVWKNVVVKNLVPAYAKKLDIIFDYLIRGNIKGLFAFFKNQRLIDIIDSIVVNLYDKLDWGLLINQINHMILFLNVPVQTSFYEEFVNIIYGKELNKNILNEFIAQFTTNTHVKEVIMSLNFSELCGYGIHQILTNKKILAPLNLTMNSDGIYWNTTGLKVSLDKDKFVITKLVSSRVDIKNTGLVCGYVSFMCNGVSFSSTSNIYISQSNDFTRVPNEFHYIYCTSKKAIYFDASVYNRLLENSTKYIKILGLCVLDSYTKKYKIDINCFEQDNNIVIEDGLVLHTIDGLPFKYNNQMDLVYIISLQEEVYHSPIKTYWKK